MKKISAFYLMIQCLLLFNCNPVNTSPEKDSSPVINFNYDDSNNSLVLGTWVRTNSQYESSYSVQYFTFNQDGTFSNYRYDFNGTIIDYWSSEKGQYAYGTNLILAFLYQSDCNSSYSNWYVYPADYYYVETFTMGISGNYLYREVFVPQTAFTGYFGLWLASAVDKEIDTGESSSYTENYYLSFSNSPIAGISYTHVLYYINDDSLNDGWTNAVTDIEVSASQLRFVEQTENIPRTNILERRGNFALLYEQGRSADEFAFVKLP